MFFTKKQKAKEQEIMAADESAHAEEEKKTVDDVIKEKKISEVLRKNVLDIVMILPIKEGTIQGGQVVSQRVQMSLITNLDFMTGVFRLMFATLAKNDPQLEKMFRKFFIEQDMMRVRVQKQKEIDLKNAERVLNAKFKNKKK